MTRLVAEKARSELCLERPQAMLIDPDDRMSRRILTIAGVSTTSSLPGHWMCSSPMPARTRLSPGAEALRTVRLSAQVSTCSFS